jgi:hypothetical protein
MSGIERKTMRLDGSKPICNDYHVLVKAMDLLDRIREGGLCEDLLYSIDAFLKKHNLNVLPQTQCVWECIGHDLYHDTFRMEVPGGWLVMVSTVFSGKDKTDAFHQDITFVSDPKHGWNVDVLYTPRRGDY